MFTTPTTEAVQIGSLFMRMYTATLMYIMKPMRPQIAKLMGLLRRLQDPQKCRKTGTHPSATTTPMTAIPITTISVYFAC